MYHSIADQIISDANCHLLNVMSCCPGGAHDSFVLQNNSLGAHLLQGAGGDGRLIVKCFVIMETIILLNFLKTKLYKNVTLMTEAMPSLHGS